MTRLRHGLVATLLLVGIPAARADFVGPEQLPSYGSASDSASDVFVTYEDYPFLADASVDFFRSLDLSTSAGQFSVFLLRPTATLGLFDVIQGQTFTSPGTGSGNPVDFVLTSAWSVHAGDIFAHYGRGIPFSSGTPANIADTLYFSSPNPPVVSGSVTLGSASFPLFSDDRNYFLNAHIAGTAVPEPGSLALLGVAGIALLARRRLTR